jgi:transposase InsO family protein
MISCSGLLISSPLEQRFHRTVINRIRHKTDRGSQYVSKAYREATEGMERSYSKKAYPWDNACIEAFHALIKREWLNRFKICSYRQAYQLVFEYIETFYNTRRIHSHCNYLSPNEFEQLFENAQKKGLFQAS